MRVRWLERRRDLRRARDAREQLPALASELAAHVRAGRSLAQAVEGAAGELGEPLAENLRASLAAIRVGVAAPDALRALGTDPDVGLLAAATSVQSAVGGDLASLLDRLSEALSDRRAHRRSAEVATAQARATAQMVSWLPAAGLAALALADRGALIGLLSEPIGWLALATSAGLTLAGRHLVDRIARVDG
jgi:tight adherence protein B